MNYYPKWKCVRFQKMKTNKGYFQKVKGMLKRNNKRKEKLLAFLKKAKQECCENVK